MIWLTEYLDRNYPLLLALLGAEINADWYCDYKDMDELLTEFMKRRREDSELYQIKEEIKQLKEEYDSPNKLLYVLEEGFGLSMSYSLQALKVTGEEFLDFIESYVDAEIKKRNE